MKVNPLNTRSIANDVSKSSQNTQGDKVKNHRDNLPKDVDVSGVRANFSKNSMDFLKAKEIASQGQNSVNESRVQELQRLIDRGEYKIDAKTLADRVVDEHLKLSN